ncbi:MAG: hypothetical protein Q4F70_01090 [Clostridia bacterium]|nr:hypothetical protein [Clostridia bacterium]
MHKEEAAVALEFYNILASVALWCPIDNGDSLVKRVVAILYMAKPYAIAWKFGEFFAAGARKTLSATAIASGPDILTIPMPPAAFGVEIAAIVDIKISFTVYIKQFAARF